MKRSLLTAALGFILAGPAYGEISTVITFPAGQNGDVQFNQNKRFGADVGNLTYSTTTKRLTVQGIAVSTLTINGQTYYFPTEVCAGGTFFRLDGAGGVSCETPTSFAVSTGTALEIWDGQTVVSSPTAGVRFDADQFNVSLVGGATAQVQLNTSSVTVMGPLSVTAPVTLSGSAFGLDKSSATLRGPDPTLGGDVSGTISAATVIDDSHSHTTLTVSGLDISADTNLSASAPLVLSGDAVTIDKSSATLLGPAIEAAELPSDGYASTYVNASGDTMTGQLTVTGSSVTVTGANGIRSTYGISGGSLSARNLSNTLVAVDSNGVLISTSIVVPNPGSANFAVSTGTVIISSPTIQVDFNGSQFTGALVGSATSQISLLSSSVTLQGQNVIKLSNTLQTGATFYVSSGTVAGQLRVDDLIATDDLTVGDDAVVTGALTVSGGAGATIASLTANRCIETDGSGRLVSASGLCGAGIGASSLAVLKSGVQVSSSTGSIDFIGEGFALDLAGANTAQVTIVSTTAYTTKNQTWTAPNTASSSWTFTTVGAHTINISSKVVWADGTASTQAVAGSNTQIQRNVGGALGADNTLTFDPNEGLVVGNGAEGLIVVRNDAGGSLSFTNTANTEGILEINADAGQSSEINVYTEQPLAVKLSNNGATPTTFSFNYLTNSFNTRKLALVDDDSHFSAEALTLTVPTNITSYTLTLPDTQGGSNETLVNDGSGNLTWGSAGGGGVYPASATASFPFGMSASTVTVSTLTVSGDLSALSLNGSFVGLGRNRILNGEMRIDQQNGGAAVSVTDTTTKYFVDQWKASANQSGAGEFTVQRSTTSPPTGFTHFIRATVTTNSTPSASHIYGIQQNMEGNNVRDMLTTSGIKATVLSFRVRSSLTGTFGGIVLVTRSVTNQFYTFSYTISSANTWEKKTIVIPADSGGSGTPETGTGGSLAVHFSLGAGSTFLASAGWATGNTRGVTGQTNVIATNGATFDLTGVQLELGTVATEYEYRPFFLELAHCQRYYEKSYAIDTAPGTNTGASAGAGVSFLVGGQTNTTTVSYTGQKFSVRKRVSPTVALWSPTGVSGQWIFRSTSNVDTSRTPGLQVNGDDSFIISNSTALEYHAQGHWTADARL